MRILVIRPGALGDVLLTLPALQALSAAFPHAAIELMGNLAAVQWLPGRSVVQAVSSFDRADLAPLFQPDAAPAASMHEYLDSFDVILSYATSPEHVFAGNLTRLSRRVCLVDGRPPAGHLHMSTYLQEPLRELGVLRDGGDPSLHLTPMDEQQATRWWEANGLSDALAVAIHPGSGSPVKNWPAERFAAVASHLQRERAMRVLWVSGPADKEAVSSVRQSMNGPYSAVERRPSALLRPEHDPIILHDLSLPLLAAILLRCRLYVGNDSGVSHLAAALGVPAVAIFGPTDPAVWAPRGPAVRIVRVPAPCAPCAVSQHEMCQERGCLDAVTVPMVLHAIAMWPAAQGP